MPNLKAFALDLIFENIKRFKIRLRRVFTFIIHVKLGFWIEVQLLHVCTTITIYYIFWKKIKLISTKILLLLEKKQPQHSFDSKTYQIKEEKENKN